MWLAEVQRNQSKRRFQVAGPPVVTDDSEAVIWSDDSEEPVRLPIQEWDGGMFHTSKGHKQRARFCRQIAVPIGPGLCFLTPSESESLSECHPISNDKLNLHNTSHVIFELEFLPGVARGVLEA